MTTTLAIETSCDDTCVSLVSEDKGYFWVQEHMQHTQRDHEAFGGVVPEVASRGHARTIVQQIEAMWPEKMRAVDTISVTIKPGLPGSLAVGRTTAQMLSQWYDKPLIEVNHIHGHILSVLLERNLSEMQLPMAVLSVSGGHNDLYLVSETAVNEKSEPVGPRWVTQMGKTLDDAVGEAFDKVARLLWGPYPGGKWLSELADSHDPETGYSADFRPSFLAKESYDFSFSGVKSQARLMVEEFAGLDEAEVVDRKAGIAYAFQESVVHVLVKKLIHLAKAYHCQHISLVGGVSANKRLREKIAQEVDKISAARQKKGEPICPFRYPKQFLYCTDNAAMIGCAGLVYGLK